jgi:hypothetical protein
METKIPSDIEIIDGQYAQGKKIQVTHGRQYDTVSTVLEGLEYLSRIQQPGDELTLECESVLTKRGQATSCQVSLTKDSSGSILF